jgi:CrcB protein
MLNYLLVAVGGALGSVARFWVATLIGEHLKETFPFGTLVVNVTGSFLIGFLATFAASEKLATSGRVFLMIGICGGYTTFSSFSLQTLQLLQNGNILYAGWNVALSVGLCMIAVWLGYLAGFALNIAK